MKTPSLVSTSAFALVAAVAAATAVAAPSNPIVRILTNVQAAEALGRDVMSYRPDGDDVSLRRCRVEAAAATCDVWYKNALTKPEYLGPYSVRFTANDDGSWAAVRVEGR